MRFAQRYYDLESFATAFITYTTTNMIRLAIPQSELDKFTAPKTEWDAAYALYADALTQTEAVRLRTA